MWAVVYIRPPRPRTDTDADAPPSSQSSPFSMRTYTARRPSSHAAPSCLPLVSARLSIFRSPYPARSLVSLARSLVSLDRSELERTLTLTAVLNAVCTVASRYYKEKPHIHGMAVHFAKAAAANAVIDGWKTVEMCQAFALWSVYNPPARRWEEDRAWCYTGIAFRSVSESPSLRGP